MAGVISMERAELLFEMEEYGKAANMVMELLNQNDTQELYKVWTLAAKSYLYLTTELTSHERESFEKTVYMAFTNCHSAEEEIWVEYQLTSAVVDWAPKTLKNTIDIILSRPTKENRNRFHSNFIPSNYNLFHCVCSDGFCVFLMSPMGSPNPLHIAKLSKEEKREIRMKVCGVAECPELNIEAIREEIFDAAMELFADLRAKLDEHSHGSLEYVKQVSPYITGELYTILSMLGGIHLKGEDAQKNPSMARKICIAELSFIRYAMEANFYPNGKAISVLLSDESQKEMQQEWYNVKWDLEEIDPDYDAGEAPSAAVVNDYNSNDGCYVATAVYGSYDCPQVWTLRRFRDNTLASTWYGRAFIRTYYAISPTLVKCFGHTAWFKDMWRGKLDKMVDTLQKQGVASTPYQDKNW